MASKNIQLKKKISGVLTDLYPITSSELVKFDDGESAAEKVAEILTLISDKTDMTSVETRIQQIIGSAPSALDTLKEIADALNNDPNFAATITTALAGKVDKISGKGLSTEDFTSTLKSKLDGIASSANNYSHPTGDGNLHVPVTGTGNSGKVLKAGSTAGSLSWGTLTASDVGAATAAQGAKADSALQSIPFETTASNIKTAGTAAAGSSGKVADAAHVHPAQTTVSGNAGTATKLATARKINGVSFDGSADITIAAGRVIFGSDPGNLTDNDLLMEEVV